MSEGSLTNTLSEKGPVAVTLSPCHPVTLSPARAWCYLVRLCLQRQSLSHQMVWIALLLLGFTTLVVAMNTAGGRWGMNHWRSPRRRGPTFEQYLGKVQQTRQALPWGQSSAATLDLTLGPARAVLDRSGFYVFTTWVVYGVFLSFLLPVWSLSFATDAIGGEREGRTLIWLLTRPLPRWSVYLGKFMAVLPWALGLNLGGFAVLCLAAGQPGVQALGLFWPAVVLGSLAFAALFQLLGACFRRAAVIALVYSFFLETILGNMPGLMKRCSIGFYVRCMMFEKAQQIGIVPPKTAEYLPVDATTACWALVGLTAVCIALGTLVFARAEYQDLN